MPDAPGTLLGESALVGKELWQHSARSGPYGASRKVRHTFVDGDVGLAFASCLNFRGKEELQSSRGCKLQSLENPKAKRVLLLLVQPEAGCSVERS